MTDEQTPAPEAGDEVVAEQAAQEAETTEEAPASEPQAEGETEQSDAKTDDEKVSPAKARRERRKAEMERLREEKAEAERVAEEYRKRLQSVSGGEDPAPKRDEFKDYDEWQAALAAHMVMSKMSAKERAQIEGQTKQSEDALKRIAQKERQEMAQQWADQEADAKARYADYEAVTRNPSLPITEAMVQAMGASEMGPDIAYYLGTNVEKAAQIARMNPLEAGRQIGLIEARLSLPKAPTQTQAPDPVTPVKAKSANVVKDPAKMTMKEYIAARESGAIR